MALLAEGLPSAKYELHLGLITGSGPGTGELPATVTIHVIGAPRVRAAALSLLRLVRRLRPEIVLSGMFHLNFLVLLLRPFFPQKTRVLVRQNGTVSAALASGSLHIYTSFLYKRLYRNADQIICQTSAMARDLSQQLGLPAARLAVLPNPVNVDGIRSSIQGEKPLWSGNGPHLLAVGRLSPEKGFDLLLRAVAQVRCRFPHVDLLIAGTGPEEKPLRSLCSELGLAAQVHFAGYNHNPWQFFPGANLFVLPSRHEGMPNALLEAAAAGLPVVALPACQGLVDLLRGQTGVWLAREISADALAASLLAALEGTVPGQRFAHPFVERFQLWPAIQAYENLIDATLRESRR